MYYFPLYKDVLQSKTSEKDRVSGRYYKFSRRILTPQKFAEHCCNNYCIR